MQAELIDAESVIGLIVEELGGHAKEYCREQRGVMTNLVGDIYIYIYILQRPTGEGPQEATETGAAPWLRLGP